MRSLLVYPLKGILLLIEILLICAFIFLTLPKIFLRSNSNHKLVLWGFDPIINNLYWANSLKGRVRRSDSIVFYAHDSFIAKNDDYDFNVEFYFFKFPKTHYRSILNIYSIINSVFIYYRYNIFVISMNGGPLRHTVMRHYDVLWARICNIKVILMCFGSDSYVYSELNDKTLQHVLLTSQSAFALNQEEIASRKKQLFRWAHFYPATTQDDFVPYWDFVRPSWLAIDTEKFKPVPRLRNNKKVVVAHAPNHRGFKGTAFIIEAINGLIADGHDIEFLLLEGLPNSEIAKLLATKVDILIDQVIAQGYALNAIEGMASGIPVVGNLEPSDKMNFFRRFSFLRECPIISTSIESLEDNLIPLLVSEELRAKKGKLGREYVEKYHSFEAVGRDWEMVFDRLEDRWSLLNHYFSLDKGPRQRD